MKVIYTDVLVIGGGLAGLRIAIGARRRGHDTIILSLVPAKRSHSKAAQGGMEVLKKAGYATGITGKWGLGEAGTSGVPNRQGFAEWYGFLNQNHAVFYYTDYLWRDGKKETIEANQNNARQKYTHDLFTGFALDFIRRQQKGPSSSTSLSRFRTPTSKCRAWSLTPTKSGRRNRKCLRPWSRGSTAGATT